MVVCLFLLRAPRLLRGWGFRFPRRVRVGISIKLLEESKMLSSLAGQTTLTAAFIDDVFSLVTLVIMLKLAQGTPTARDILVPLFGSFIFLGASVRSRVTVTVRAGPRIAAGGSPRAPRWTVGSLIYLRRVWLGRVPLDPSSTLGASWLGRVPF